MLDYQKKKFFTADPYRDTAGIARIVKEGLCHRCGCCVGFCPIGTYETDADGYPKAVNQCIHCNICVNVCSGLSVDYEKIGKAYFDENYKFGSYAGETLDAYLAHAGEPDVRTAGASGGVVSQLLIHWLESGKIKGALIVVEDEKDPSKGKGFIARNREDVIRGAQSRYTTAPSFSALLEIKDEEGPFAVVGLPCQIHSLRKRQLADPKWRKKITITIGLYCHYNLSCTAARMAAKTFTPKGKQIEHVRFRQRDSRGWPHNTLELWFKDGTKWRSPYGPAQTFNVVSRVAPLGRCLMCLDSMAEFADLAVGDPWIRDNKGRWKYEEPEGWSSIITRNEMAQALIKDAADQGKLVVKRIPAREIYEGQHAMIIEKKERVAFRLKVRKLLGLPIPRYPMQLPKTSPAQLKKELQFWFTRLVPIFPAFGHFLLWLGFSPVGGYFVKRRMQKREKLAAQGKFKVSASDFGEDE